jgi:hypothetical protein
MRPDDHADGYPHRQRVGMVLGQAPPLEGAWKLHGAKQQTHHEGDSVPADLKEAEIESDGIEVPFHVS